MEKVNKLLELYETNRLKNNQYILKDAFNDLDLSRINIEEGSNCLGMSKILQSKLKKIGINSYIIRFKAGGVVDSDYLQTGHAGLVIPRIIDGKQAFTFMDPGLLVSKPITFFADGPSPIIEIGNKKFQIINNGNSEYPFVMKDLMRNRMFEFDPSHERVNPIETLNKDVMRTIGDYKIAKQDEYGNVSGLFRVDIQNNTIELRVGKEKYEGISYNKFLNIELDQELASKFEDVSKILGIDKGELFYNTKRLIRNTEAYKDLIWTNKTRIENNKSD